MNKNFLSIFLSLYINIKMNITIKLNHPNSSCIFPTRMKFPIATAFPKKNKNNASTFVFDNCNFFLFKYNAPSDNASVIIKERYAFNCTFFIIKYKGYMKKYQPGWLIWKFMNPLYQ